MPPVSRKARPGGKAKRARGGGGSSLAELRAGGVPAMTARIDRFLDRNPVSSFFLQAGVITLLVWLVWVLLLERHLGPHVYPALAAVLKVAVQKVEEVTGWELKGAGAAAGGSG